MERYVIHACKARMWYVDEFIIPSMLKQGIARDEILVWCDTESKGNLLSCIECFEHCGKSEGGCWHLQDDVLLAPDFAKRTRLSDDRIECGFCHILFEKEKGRSVERIGEVNAQYMWSSFPCIYIPNRLAGEFAEWYYKKASYRSEYQRLIFDKHGDDRFFRDFIDELHPDEKVFNHVPALVDHVDWLIGGSVANRLRGTNCRAYYWIDEGMVESLKNTLRKGEHRNGVLF